MKFLRRLFLAFVYLLPAVLFFSYYPLINLGKNSTMNFELSLPLIWLALFDLVSFTLIIITEEKQKKKLRLAVMSALLFPLYAGWSIFWSPNPLRAFLTSGVLWLVVLAIAGFVVLLPKFAPPTFRATWLKIFFISSAAVCLFCWLQSLLDLAGCPRETTLLCPGCTAQTFGFPHPSGFAIEPQFMGNLLLAPALTALYLLVFKKSSGLPKRTVRCLLIILSFLFSATLFFTLSRGAIYAFACALIILLIFALKSRANWRPIILIPLSAFIFTLAAQGTFAALGPTSDNFVSGATKSLHQLSLGIVDLRPASVKSPQASPESSESTASEISPSSPPAPQAPKPANQSRFDGYIASSTNERTGLNALALTTWRRNLPTALFGVGLGGAGLAMSETFPANPLAAPNALVQNQFLSLLLELGVVGAILLACSIWQSLALLFETIRSATSEEEAARARDDGPRERRVSTGQRQGIALIVALLAAYLITLNFFSGLPNALQIYLLPPLLFFIFRKNSRKNPCASQK